MLEHKKAIAKFNSDLYGSLNIWKDEQGREYYKALDVCSALRLQNVSQSLSRYVDKEYIQQFDDGSHRGGKTNYLSEPGLYQLIFASKTDWAKQFQKWVFEDILPKLRSSGGYIMPTATSDQLEALKIEAQELQDANKLLTKSNKLLEASTKIAEENSQQALQVTQKILRYFLALNRVAWNLYVDLRLIDPIARKENKTKSDWERIDRAYRNSGGTALCFLRRWRENIEESSNFLCTYSDRKI